MWVWAKAGHRPDSDHDHVRPGGAGEEEHQKERAGSTIITTSITTKNKPRGDNRARTNEDRVVWARCFQTPGLLAADVFSFRKRSLACTASLVLG